MNGAAQVGGVEDECGCEEIDESVVVARAEMVVERGIFENVEEERFPHGTLTNTSQPCGRLGRVRNELVRTRRHHCIRQLQ